MEKLLETFRHLVESKQMREKKYWSDVLGVDTLIGAEAFEVVLNYVSPAEPSDWGDWADGNFTKALSTNS